MVTDFKLEIKKHENCLVMDTYGYINNIGGQKIVDEFNKNKNDGVNHFILNLAESKIVNSIGISYLIEIIEILNSSNGKLIFTNLDPSIEKTFTIMGLFQFAEKAATVEEALNKYQ
jgi:anti-anti-sigma factor